MQQCRKTLVSPSFGSSLLEWSSGPFTWLLFCPPSLPWIFSVVCFSCFAAPSLPLHPLSFLCTCPDCLRLASLSLVSPLIFSIVSLRSENKVHTICDVFWYHGRISLMCLCSGSQLSDASTDYRPVRTRPSPHTPEKPLKLKCSLLNPGQEPQTETSTNCFHLVTWNKHTHTFIFLQILH